MTDKNSDADWVVYLIRTRHDALYCGITNNLTRRFDQHQQGKGAKALKGKGPLSLEWTHIVDSKVQRFELNTLLSNSLSCAKSLWLNSGYSSTLRMRKLFILNHRSNLS